MPVMKTPMKCNLQDMLMLEEQTPLRESDRVCSKSQEKKRQAQLDQARKMICTQGKSIEKQGVSPGAVVVVQVDYRAVSHAIGIVGVIYQIKPSGRAQIATVMGILSSGPRLGKWWIPSDHYVLKARAGKEANIPHKLEIICAAILSGEYNNNNAAVNTIQAVHQAITQSISPCWKSKCGCSSENCKVNHCGCIKKGFKCTSACPCNRNCNANTNNGKWFGLVRC
jgi:hypothetical protein